MADCIGEFDKYTHLGSGFTSQCYTKDGRVIKISPFKTRHEAFYHAASASKWYKIIGEYLGPYIISTEFCIARQPIEDRRYSVLQHQPLVRGIPFAESLRTGDKKYLGHVNELMNRCVRMGDDLGVMPDLFGTVSSLHDVSTTNNIIGLVDQCGLPEMPILVDVIPARLSRWPHTSMVANMLLRYSASALVAKLDSKKN